MRKLYFVLICLFASHAALAITQQGHVRTISRPNRPSENLEGVLIRVRGNHNTVLSEQTGTFAILMQELQNGDPYVLSAVIKSGYELKEQEMIGRRQALSEYVPLEVLMVSSKELLVDRMAIEQKARENVERHYQERLKQLDAALAASRMTAEQYEQELTELENKYDRFEPLLQTMSRHYACTDFQSLDSLTMRINEQIEMGNLDEAERLIQKKGNLDDRERQLREMENRNRKTEDLLREAQQQLAKQKTETSRTRTALADDYFFMYTITLERMQCDSADMFICRRAELDTTNVEYQLQAGQFVMIYMADYDRALGYFYRALRQSELQNGYEYGDVATSQSEIGMCYNLKGDWETALDWYNRSMTLTEQLTGKNSLSMAESYNNLGALYQKQGKIDDALKMMRKALIIREKNMEYGDPLIAQSYNNVGVLLFYKNELSESQIYFDKALSLFRNCYGWQHREVASALNNLGSICFMQSRFNDAADYFQQALAIYTQVFGNSHPQTRQTQANIDYLQQWLKK